MKIRSLILTIALYLLSNLSMGQTIVFHENFEPVSGADSVTSQPANTWGISNVLSINGSVSDSCTVKLGDTTYLTTNTFSTTGMQYVLLDFDQICKIEFFDNATIEVSNNNGSTWTKLTGGQYLGSGQFTNVGNKFNATSYSDWMPTNNYATPTNSWWKHELFDISTLASNASQVKIRFVLADINNSGNAGAYGWLLDNIKVTAAIDELIPPVITFQAPLLQDSVFNFGPYLITASITDNSGIDTALLIYSINGGTNDTVPMIYNYGSVYTGLIDTIPAFSLYDTICYHVWAMDSSLTQNTATNPSSCQAFIIYNSQPYPGCSNPITTFPYIQSFDQNFSPGSGYPSSPGALDGLWTRNPSSSSSFMWLVYNGSTSSTGTGPTSDHTTGSGNYLFTESSYGSSGASAELYSPCVDLNAINVPVLEFYYHMMGNSMGELHVDIWYGNSWVTDIMSPIIGNQGNSWHKASVNLNNYKAVTKIRIRAIRGSSYLSDIAIDDVKIWEPPAYDAGMVSIDRPVSPANTGNQPVKATFANFGSASLTKITINWQVNGQTMSPYIWTGILTPGSTADSIVIGTHNFISGPSNIKIWTSAPNDSVDGFNQNDTVQTSVIACTSPLHGVFTIGGVAADFMTFSDALYAIENCGIDSAITFYVNAGTYTEQLEFDTIPGSSIQNTITFESANGDSTGVILEYAPNSSQAPHVVLFNGGSHITFKNMTISSTGTSYGRLFVFKDDASYNTVENCILIMPSGSYYYTNAAYAVSTISEHNSFINNDISNGYYAFYFSTGSSATSAKGNTFIKNNMHGFRYYAAYLQYQDSFTVVGNTFINDTSSTSVYPLYIYRGAGAFRIEKNNIQAHGSSTIYGLRLYYCTSPQNNPGIIANNMVSLTGNSSYPYGLYLYNCQNVNVYYNTVNIDVGGSSPNGRALYLSSGSNIRLKNNILSNNSDGYVAYFGTSTAIIESDYNDYYASAQNFAYWSGTGYVNNLADLQTASGKEVHSVSLAPTFISNTDLHLAYSSLNNLANPIPSITEDIDGELRSSTTPAMGADEQPPIPIDAGVVSIISPASTENEADSVNVIGLIKNFGTDTLFSFDYYYTLNGLPQDTQSYSMALPPFAVDTITFPKFIISPGHNNICINTLLSSDTNNFNDHVCKYFYGIPIVDMGVLRMETPDSGQCFTNSEALIVTIKNYGSQPLNLNQKPVVVHTTVTGPNTITVPNYTLSTGILAVGATAQITLSTGIDMNHTGDYYFDIWTSVADDGDHTNDSIPTKKISVFATVISYPYSQGFENFGLSTNTNDPGVLDEGWGQQTVGPDYTWYVGSNSTYTNSTGPTADHTLGTASGKYCYAEAGYYAGTVNLISPCIDLSNMTHPTLRYWYHMYGSNIHSLRVDVYASGQWHYSLGHIMGQQQSSSADPWKQDIVDLSTFAGQVIKLRFRAIKLNGYEADIAVDDIFVYEPTQKDAGISDNFQQPASNFAAQGTKVPIEVKIENYGLDTLKDLYVGYIAGNNAPIMEHWTGSIPPYSYQLHLFSTNYTVQAGETKIRAYTSYTGDMNTGNDTGTFSFTGISVFNVPYTDDFEGKNYFVSTGGLKQWQRGNPNKNTFSSPHSGNNAWVTSLLDVYLNNSNDYLYTPFFNLGSFSGTYMRFWHRFETQASHDGGVVEYSTDGGSTFTSLGYIADPASTNWYNTNIGGTHMWAGPDSGWVHSTYNLSQIPTGSPVQFRFKFYSDNTINNYDGWMIDDFEITPNPISKDAGINNLLAPSGYTTPGASTTVSVELKNYGTTNLTQIPVNYRIDNGNVVTQNWMGTLTPGATANFTFTSTYTATGTYDLEVWTSATGDTHWFNDSIKVTMAKDAGVFAIINPKPIMGWNDSIDVIVQFKNYGNDTITSCDLYYDANGGGGVTETWTGVLAPGKTTFYTFNQKYLVNYGIVNFCAKTILSGDTKASNDKTCSYITGTIGLPDTENKSFSVSQNTPNPFNKYSVLNVNLPNADQFSLTITDITGKIISYQEFKGKKGNNDVEIDGHELSQGIYFYQVKYKNQTAVKKMIIIE